MGWHLSLSPALTETYLSKERYRIAKYPLMREELEPTDPKDEKSAESDLARRLERYRRRVEAEGRPRSVKLIDRAIEDADRKSRGDRKRNS